jgi:hypothetical protein
MTDYTRVDVLFDDPANDNDGDEPTKVDLARPVMRKGRIVWTIDAITVAATRIMLDRLTDK